MDRIIGPGGVTQVKTAPGDAVDTFVQDQTTPPIEFWMYRDLNAIVINTAAGSRTNTLELDPGHLLVVGDFINIYHVDTDFLGSGLTRKSFIQREVVQVAVDTIRIDMFVGFDLDPANVVSAQRVTVEQNVLGTIDAPIRFELKAPGDLIWDLTRVLPTMVLSNQPDDAKFGDIAGGITNGVFFGFESDTFDGYLINVKQNSDFRATAFDVNYPIRSGGTGSFGLSTRKSFSGRDKYGVAIRLDGSTNDSFVKYVQDDLTTLLSFRDKIMGHITEGEDEGVV